MQQPPGFIKYGEENLVCRLSVGTQYEHNFKTFSVDLRTTLNQGSKQFEVVQGFEVVQNVEWLT